MRQMLVGKYISTLQMALFFIHLITLLMNRPDDTATLHNFSTETTAEIWEVQDDVVMGGKSSGHLEMTPDGHARFYGEVSLENNGGFSSILGTLKEPHPVAGRAAFSLRLRGDGKAYTFRVKSAAGDGFYHEAAFETNGDWETITIPFASMNAVHHGEPVNVPNYAGQAVHKLQLLIGNKKAETFEILVDVIELV